MESGFLGKAHGTIAGIAQKHPILDSGVVHTILRLELVSSETYTGDVYHCSQHSQSHNPTMYQLAKVQIVCSDLDKLALLGTDLGMKFSTVCR